MYIYIYRLALYINTVRWHAYLITKQFVRDASFRFIILRRLILDRTNYSEWVLLHISLHCYLLRHVTVILFASSEMTVSRGTDTVMVNVPITK